jgi:hypothetical protein
VNDASSEIMRALQHFDGSPTWCEDCYVFSEVLAYEIPKVDNAEFLNFTWEKVRQWVNDSDRKEDNWKEDYAVWRRIFGLHQLATKEAFEYYCLKGIFQEWQDAPYGDWLSGYGFESDELKDMVYVLETIITHPHFSEQEFSLREIARLRHMGQGLWMGMCKTVDLNSCDRCMPIVEEIAENHNISL